jgi:phage tail sheath protein FI
MPVTPTYPGVYIEEVRSEVRTIVGVATSITAFIGRALRGPVNDPIRIQNFGDFTRRFGGLWVESSLGYAVQQYFQNGGADALIVRVHNGAGTAAFSLVAGAGTFGLVAANPGAWGGNLRMTVDYDTSDPANTSLFNLTVQEFASTTPVPSGGLPALRTETFRNLSVNPLSPSFVTTVLEQGSDLVRVSGAVADRPDPASEDTAVAAVDDGIDITDTEISDPLLEAVREGLWALEKADLFNLLCIPPLDRSGTTSEDVDPGTTLAAALEYCKDRRAMLIVDPPTTWDDPDDVTNAGIGVDSLGLRDENAAVYFPRLMMPDPERNNRLQEFPPCGVVAGVIARTDATRGVWKAPAGQDTVMSGVRALSYKLTDGQNGILNPLGVNCLRSFPVIGNVVWGARTLEGADRLASEWKYIPVRRLALFIEESLYRGTQWVVFEPNDEPLWSQIRLNVGAFMHNLFRQGAFQGRTPREAYLVKCDAETTTQADINLGIVNVVVGFAPLKPAEFVIIRIQQLAGQLEA